MTLTHAELRKERRIFPTKHLGNLAVVEDIPIRIAKVPASAPLHKRVLIHP